MTRKWIVLLLVAYTGALSGCAGSVIFGHTVGSGGSAAAPPAAAAPAVPSAAPIQPRVQTSPATLPITAAPRLTVTAVTVAVTPAVRDQLAAEPRLKDSALLAAVNAELRARKLLGDPGSQSGRTLQISVDAFATRASSNAVLFGYIVGSGTLAGEVIVRDAADVELRRFRVQAASRLMRSASGQDENPLGALYRRFANLAVDNLTGTPSKPDDTDVVPR